MDAMEKEYHDDTFNKNQNGTENNMPNSANKSHAAYYDNAATTGSGYSQAERNLQDSTNADPEKNKGSESLVNKYNINDQAHSDSSINDFVATKSAFHHNNESPEKE